MKDYFVQRKLFDFPSGIEVQEAEKAVDQSPALVARFPHRDDVDISVYHRAWKCAAQLRNTPRLLMPLEIETGGEEFACEMAFGLPGELQPLSKISHDKETDLWIMRSAAEVLDDLHLRRVSGQYVGEYALFVDKKDYKVELGFVGLADIFRAHDETNGDRGARADWRDDVNKLAKYFEVGISKLPQSEFSDVVKNCLSEDPTLRPKPSELLDAMRGIRAFRPHYEDKVDLVFNSKHFADEKADEILDLLNRSDCYHTEWKQEEHNGKMQQKCDFFVGGYQGIFINSEGDDHWFVPSVSNKKSAAPLGTILRSRFAKIERGFPVSPKGENYYHHLTALGAEKSEAVKDWRSVPEKEKAFILKHSFKEEYQHCHVCLKGKRFSFILRAGAGPGWQKIDDLREKEKQLDAVPMYVGDDQDKISVGYLDDLKRRWVLHVESDRDDIPRSGKIRVEGLSGDAKFLFRWRKNGALHFVMDDWGEYARNRSKLNGVAVFMDGINGRLGTLVDASEFPEIITRDYEAGSQPPAAGKLREDVGLEIIPLNHQIESVRAFEKSDMAEPQLGGILATPQEHRPPIIPPDASSIEFFSEHLDESQKDAVVGALFQKPLFLIHGPPGTGKTTVIVELIRQALRLNPRARILVCSQTNLAVDNVMERLPDEKIFRPVRLAWKSGKITKSVQKFHFASRFKKWVESTIQRGGLQPQTAMAKAFAKSRGEADMPNPKRQNRIDRAVNQWHRLLRNDEAEIRANVDGGWSSMEMAFLRSMNVVGATCVHLASRKYRPIFGDRYDYLIMDEAGKATPAETLIPVVRAKQIVLIGDHKQLPPFVTDEDEVWEKVKEERPELEDAELGDVRKFFGESLFEKLIKGFEMEESIKAFLSVQRRMPVRLGELISKYFYDGKLENPDGGEFSESKKADLPDSWQAGVLFINTGHRRNPHDDGDSNWRQNPCNADVVVETLQLLSDTLPSCDVSVIAGYRGQVALLRQNARHAKCLKGNPDDLINTVDGFQGRESDVVIYDVVRSSPGRSTLGFLDEPRRLNVALSRAKKLLIIVGDATFLSSRAMPSKDRSGDAQKPILGEIVDELAAENLVFDSLEESLK